MAGGAVVTIPHILLSPSLKGLEDGKCLTEEGRYWFIEATDPFHDEPIRPSGYPDTNISGSIVQCVKQSLPIAVPETLAGADWDCNFVMWPNVISQTTHNYSQKAPGIFQDGDTALAAYSIGGMTGLAAASGDETYGANTGIVDTTTLAGPYGLPISYLQGSMRVIGMGFEVVNTTAPLYKQGQVMVWRQPSPTPETMVDGAWFNAPTSVVASGNLTTYIQKQPPGSLAEAALLSGSKSWEAADGCYCVATMNEQNNSAIQPAPRQICVKTADSRQAEMTDSIIAPPLASFTIVNSGGTTNVLQAAQNIIAPYNMVGAYFTGLSTQTTLQVNTVYYIERFPSASEADLVVLASPSAAFDPCALELYGRVMAKLPVGVPQGMNPMGEWFKEILRKVTHFATPILKSLSAIHPAFAGGALISDTIGGLVGKRPKKKNKVQVQQVIRAVRRPPVPPRPKNFVSAIRAEDRALSQAIVPYRAKLAYQPLPQRMRRRRRGG